MNREIKFRVFDKVVGEMVDKDMHVFGESFALRGEPFEVIGNKFEDPDLLEEAR